MVGEELAVEANDGEIGVAVRIAVRPREAVAEENAVIAVAGSELVVVLTILAEDRGGADRAPRLPPEGLHVPNVGLRIVDPEKDRIGVGRIEAVIPDELVP